MTRTSSRRGSHSAAGGHTLDEATLAARLRRRVGLSRGGADHLAGAVIDAALRAARAEPPLTAENAREFADRFTRGIPRYPARRFHGRGVVICAGGVKYFTCAWVCIGMLRRSGCRLPIELWHLGPAELDDRMRRLVAPLGVDCVDALDVRSRHPARILRGWELKPFAMLHSRFEHVMLLDADNVPIADPTSLFDTPAYRATGAVFWPDAERLGPEREIWRICGVPFRDEPEIESGQIVLNKRRCWRPLQLTMHMNEHSDFYYRHIHGDKDTFHMAWRMLGQEYAMVPVPMRRLPGVMCQHDLDGRRIFQHRNAVKWRWPDEPVEGFEREDECRRLLRELASLWDGRIDPGPSAGRAG